ncbi:hypothetical protein VMCG_03720 [Cytospora schulzeri]|uniref:RTA1 domain protein n=1 Tax=Cytospora schulzeri TaxID=448051 RepID=A0A423WV24_9PEZI|nr:hypothetical protein VMCG_03720 [Valsa malicola]
MTRREQKTKLPGTYWFYAPDKGAPVFFAAAFLASGIYPTLAGLPLQLLAGVMALRIVCRPLHWRFHHERNGAFDYEDLVAYIVSQCLVYAAPPLYQGANYSILGRILLYVPQMHPGRVWCTFSGLALLIECISGLGASYTSNPSLPQSTQDSGKALTKAALILQVIIVNLLLFLAVTFHRCCLKAGIHKKKHQRRAADVVYQHRADRGPTIYRVVEYYGAVNLHYTVGMDADGFPLEIKYEWLFYVFEATLMLCNAYLWNIRHPQKYIPKSTKVYLDQDGVTEVKEPDFKNTKSKLASMVDPFDLAGLVKGRDHNNRFWENIEVETGPLGGLSQSSGHQTV